MNLILISGAEATCKSDIGKKLSEKTGYTYLSKDMIKEVMFDKGEKNTWNYGWYESRAKKAFFAQIEQLVHSETNAIIESNFIGKDREALAAIIASGVTLKEIHCHANGLTSFRRAVRRNESGRRHPGHHDRRWYPKVLLQSLLHIAGVYIGAHKPVQLADDVLYVNTTSYPAIDFDDIVRFVRS